MREHSVETHLRKKITALGGRALKLNPLGLVGVPDRLVVLPAGVVVFVELKRPRGGVVAGAQTAWHSWLRARGHWVEVLKTKGEVDEFLRRAGNTMGDREDGHPRSPGDA